jgi:hypothetical protein
MGILCDHTVSGKIEDGGLKISNKFISASESTKSQLIQSGNIRDGGLITSNTYISAPRQDINEIPTATPMFSEPSFPLGLMEILCDQTGSKKIQS